MLFKIIIVYSKGKEDSNLQIFTKIGKIEKEGCYLLGSTHRRVSRIGDTFRYDN